METEKLKLQVPETQMYVIKTKRHPIGFTAKSRASDTGEFVSKVKQRRRRRQERNRFRLSKQQLCTCSTLFGTFLCRLRRTRRRQQTISYSLLSVTWISSFRTQLHKNLPKLKNSTMNKSYEV